MLVTNYKKKKCRVCRSVFINGSIFCTEKCQNEWEKRYVTDKDNIFIISKSNCKHEKNPKKYCRTCESTIRGIAAFCNTECEFEWREYNKNYVPNESCAYEFCRYRSQLLLGASYCSMFCYTQQNTLNGKRNEEFISRVYQIIEDIDKIPVDSNLLFQETFVERYARLERIETMKNNQLSLRIEYVRGKVNELTFDAPLYFGPVEQASNLFGSGLVSNPKSDKSDKSSKSKSV